MGLSWNSWYNPLDNITSAAKSVAAGTAAWGGAPTGNYAQEQQNKAFNTTPKPAATPQVLGDSTAYNGALYYDTNAGKVQEYRDGGWGDPTAAPDSPSSGGSNGGGNSGPTAAQRAAQVQAAAEAKRMSQIRGNLETSQKGIKSSGQQSANDLKLNYKNSSTDFINGIRTGQDEINQADANNILNFKRTIGSIANGIRNGIRSGGVSLAGLNASDSGAAEAMARAYADEGNMQWADANNETALTGQQIDLDQVALNREKEEGEARLTDFRTNETGRIRSDLFDKLNVLNTEAKNEGVTGVIDTGIADRLVAEALAALQVEDTKRTKAVGNIKGMTEAEINARASEMEAAGMAGTSPFAIPEGAQLTRAGGQNGAPISQLPIFARRFREE